MATHSSRLRERLFDACPYLCGTGKQGEDFLISFQSDIDDHTRTSIRDFQSQAFQFVDVAKNIRRDVFEHETNNNEQDWQDMMKNQDECTPFSLKTLLRMIVRGPGSISPAQEDDDDEGFHQVINTLSQLISYHTIKRRRTQSALRRHAKGLEKPVPVHLAMKIYGETKITGKLGLSISYDHLQNLLDEKASSLRDW